MSNLVENIRSNALSHGSIPFWSWNDRLKPEELRRQIQNMYDLGMKGFFMHARGGLETEYLSDEWFDDVRVCIEEARRLGMEAWSYDENGWPSGFAGGILLEDPANHATWLDCQKSAEFPTGDDILGVYVIRDGKLSVVDTPCGADEYIVIHQKYDSSYVDTMDADITRKFIAATHEEYKKRIDPKDFGTVMPGFFTDEPQYYRWATPYSNTMPREFAAHYGYDVKNALPALFCDFEGADELRYDYYKLCHELFINNFIKVIYDWCEENHCQITGHAVEESFLGGQMWCCGGVMPFYEYEHIPGIDYLGRGISNDIAPRQLGSACEQLGKKMALSEMFGCCGWDVSPSELKRIAELQYVNGVNLMCQHLYSYSIRGQRKRDYPNHYSDHCGWQKFLKEFDNYFNNLGYTLSLGSEAVNTLVIHPIHSAYLHYKRQSGGIDDLERGMVEVSNLLSNNQIAYHWGDENMMARMAKVEGKTIRVGLCTYDTIVLPHLLTIDASTAALLKEFIANGGKVWMATDAPTRIDGHTADLSFLHSTTTFEDIKAAAMIKLSLDGKNVPALRATIRNTEFGRIFYITNLHTQLLKDVKVRIENCAGVYALDMDTLEKKPVLYKPNADGSLEVTLTVEGAQAYVLVEGTEIAPLTEEILPGAPIKLSNSFRFSKQPDNMLTLDYASISYDGVTYEKVRPIVAVKDMLFSNRYNGDLYLKYTFTVKELPETLSVAVEPMQYTSFKVNGQDIALTDKWWLDRSFRTADILSAVQVGVNEVTMSLHYFQRDYVYYVLYGGVSESLRNCLAFDTEIESIYLFGRFNVDTDASRFTAGDRNSWCYDGAFALTAPKSTIDLTNIVTDGYPFYGGEISAETEYDYADGMPTELYVTGRYAVCEVSVNGVKAATLMFSNHCDLKPFLREGVNIIGLSLYNSNRNLLGPHHRHDPEPFGVGPGTFSFEKEWHNDECPGYLDRYAFVRFGIDL